MKEIINEIIAGQYSYVYITGDADCCFIVLDGMKTITMELSLDKLYDLLDKTIFIRVNNRTIINTLFYVGNIKGREIKMKNGTMFRVSRRKWDQFV